MNKPGLVHRVRSWLAGRFFLLAGRFDSAYDVWLDDAPPRHARRRHQPGEQHAYELACKVCDQAGIIRVSVDPARSQ